MTSGAFPAQWTSTHKIASHILASAAVLARGVIAMAVLQSARFSFPAVLALALKVSYSVDTSAVVAARIRRTIVGIY